MTTATRKGDQRRDAVGTVTTGTATARGGTHTADAHETWLDWVGKEPPELITRDELLDRLRRDGIDVPVRTLTYWESAGILPRPVRRWRAGSPKALYPAGWEVVVKQLRRRQEVGVPLSEISEELRRVAPVLTHRGARNWTSELGERALQALIDFVESRGDDEPRAEGFTVNITAADGRILEGLRWKRDDDDGKVWFRDTQSPV